MALTITTTTPDGTVTVENDATEYDLDGFAMCFFGFDDFTWIGISAEWHARAIADGDPGYAGPHVVGCSVTA